MKKVLVVYNFLAGRKKAISYKKKLQKFLLKNSECFKFITIDGLSDSVAEGFDTIIAMGGDGTVNKVLPYVISNDLSLGIVPCGTANLLAERLGIPSGIDNAISVLKNGKNVLVDTININEKDCILRMGLGYDFDIISKTPQSLKNKFGYFAYFIAGILFALRLKNKEYRFVFNQELVTVKSSCIIVANSDNMYRNWFRVGRSSKLDDGMFDVFVLKTTNPILFFFEFVKIGLNIHNDSKFALYFKTNNLKIESNFLHSHIDGEKIALGNSVQINVSAKKVRVIGK